MKKFRFKFLPSRNSPIRRKLIYASIAILATIIFGASGFCLIEGLSLLDGIYLATQTVTSVGYGDLPPKTVFGKIFAIFFMLGGGGTVLYALSILAQAVIQSEILNALGKRRITRGMSKLNNHFIICGAGRVGNRIIRELKRQNLEFVIIERDEKKVSALLENGEYVIVGDATLEENMNRAGVARARGLAACLPDDADNVYVVLTARGMNSKMHIVSRAVEEQAETKLIRAGANRVIAPILIGGINMARALTKPAIADFMDSITAENLELVFEEVLISDSSNYIGKKLKDSNLRSELDLIVVAVKRKNGEMIFHPSGETEIMADDLLIVIGRAEAMQKLMQMVK